MPELSTQKANDRFVLITALITIEPRREHSVQVNTPTIEAYTCSIFNSIRSFCQSSESKMMISPCAFTSSDVISNEMTRSGAS